MVVVKPVDREMACQKLTDDSDPGGGVLPSIDDKAIPFTRDRLDGFPVTEPADVDKIGGYHVMLAHELLDGRHPWVVGQGQGYPMGAQEIEESWRDPATSAELDGELVTFGEPVKGRF